MKKGIRTFVGLIGGGTFIFFAMGWQQKCIDRWREQAEKNRAMFLLMNQWINLKQEGRSIEEFFIKNGFKKIAVYGMGAIGERLVKELKNSEVEVAYGIDKNQGMIYSDFKIVTMEDDFAEVDAVVVTVVKEFDAIQEALLEKINCSVIAIEDILDEF